MGKRKYIVAVSMIALLIQSGNIFAVEGQSRFAQAGQWARGKAAAVKGATVDELYKKAKAFVKEVKELKKCSKAGNCTPEQNKKVRTAALAISAMATAVIAATLVYTIKVYKPKRLVRIAADAFQIKVEKGSNEKKLLDAVALRDSSTMNSALEEHDYSLPALRAALHIATKIQDTDAEKTLRKAIATKETK